MRLQFIECSNICAPTTTTLAVEDELAALKKGSAKEPVGALPEGKPIKDVFDMELDELRKKAKS